MRRFLLTVFVVFLMLFGISTGNSIKHESTDVSHKCLNTAEAANNLKESSGIKYIFLENHAEKKGEKFLSYGSGNCTLIHCQNKYYLVDTFTDYEMTHYVLPILKRNNVQAIEAVFITHYHSDHSGGLVSLLKNGFNVKKVYLPPEPDWSQAAIRNMSDVKHVKRQSDSIISYLKQNNIDYKYCVNETVKLDRNFTVKILNADYKPLYRLTKIRPKGNNSRYPDEGIYTDYNNYSVFYMFDYSGTKALFTGDANNTPLNLALPKLEKVQLWCITHHDHDYFANEAFLKKIRPDIAVAQDTPNEYEKLTGRALWNSKCKMGRYCIKYGASYYNTCGFTITVTLSDSLPPDVTKTQYITM